MTQQYQVRQDWTRLASGDPVTVIEADGQRYSAVVDTKTADSTVVWVFDSYGFRRAFDHREDVELTVQTEAALAG